MTALKCVLWRRPRNTRRRHSGIMSLVQTSHNERKCKIKSKQCLKRWCSGRNHRHVTRARPGSEREMPCLEPTSGSEVVPCSPEMPTLLPFTTENEDQTSGVYQITCSTSPEKDGHQFVRVLRGGQNETYQPVVVLKRLPPLEGCPQQEDDIPGSAFELEELRRRDVLVSPLGGGFSSTRDEDDWLQWPLEYEGCSCEDLVDISPVSSFPEIDVIDGVEFFSFLQEEDMINYSRLHSRSWFFGDSSTPQDDSPTLSSEDFSEEKSGGLIFPTKTKDITQIKGWKRKLFAEECEDFESASWTIRKKEEESLDISEEKPPLTCSAFTSSSLEDFLKTSSQLRISYLASYIPNVTPIPSDSPILSVGTLTKDIMPTRDISPASDSIVQKTLRASESNDLPFTTETKNVRALKSEEGATKSDLVCGPLTLEEETVSLSNDDPSRADKIVDLQLEQNLHRVETPCEEHLLNESKCHRSVIREPVFDSEVDQLRLSEFLSELRQPSVYAMFCSRYEGPKTNMDCPTITEKMANTVAEALSRIVNRKIQKMQEFSSVKVMSHSAVTLDGAEKTPPEKRNKRMIRLPARFLDSAVIFPGCEGWVTPELPNTRKRRRKSEVTSRGERSRSRNGKSKSGGAAELKMEEEEVTVLAEYETRQTSSKGNSDASRDLVQLKHLKDHDLVGATVVRSLLIVHPSLRVRDTVAKSVSLPLAGIALPIDSSQKFDGREPLVYLLYGAKDALLQNHWSASQSSSLDNLLQSDSPVVPVLRKISLGVSLEKSPLCVKSVLESKVQTLLVYLASCPPVVSNGELLSGAPAASSTMMVGLLSEKSNGDTETAEVSSSHVSRSKIVVKSTFAGNETVLPKKCVPVPGENGSCPELGDGDDSEARSRARRKAEAVRRKDLRRQMRYLYDTLLSDSERNEKNVKLSGIEILQKATEDIFSLCKKAKELEVERRHLRVTHNRLVESYASCLDDLPADCRKSAIDSLSRQIEVTARRSDCPRQEKKRIEDAEVQKVAKAAWSLVGPCSVRRVELRNGHTVYVYSSHAEEEDKKAAKKEENDAVIVVEEEEETATSLWVSDVGEPCFVTRLLPEEDDENR